MFPDGPFQTPRGSFQTPVIPPGMDPDASPTLTVSINCAWLPYIRGALQQLLLQSTWDALTPADLLLTQQRAWSLIAMFEECTGSLPFACPYDFAFSDGGWVPVHDTDLTPPDEGIYLPLGGWTAVNCTSASFSGLTLTRLLIELSFPTPIQVTGIDVLFDYTKGTFNTGPWINGVGFKNGGSIVFDTIQNAASMADGFGQTMSAAGAPATADKAFAYFTAAGWTGAGSGGLCEIRRIQISGVGATPPGC